MYFHTFRIDCSWHSCRKDTERQLPETVDIVTGFVFNFIAMSSFPPTDAPDWCNLNVLHRNSLPPRAFFNNFTTAQEALSYDEKRSTTLCLNGQWKFHHCISPFEAPEGFQRPDFDASQWKDLNVPSMWQMEGYSKPHYSNVEYVFPVDPPFGLAAHPPCPVSKLTDRQCRTTTTRLEAISRNSDCPRM